MKFIHLTISANDNPAGWPCSLNPNIIALVIEAETGCEIISTKEKTGLYRFKETREEVMQKIAEAHP